MVLGVWVLALYQTYLIIWNSGKNFFLRHFNWPPSHHTYYLNMKDQNNFIRRDGVVELNRYYIRFIIIILKFKGVLDASKGSLYNNPLYDCDDL